MGLKDNSIVQDSRELILGKVWLLVCSTLVYFHQEKEKKKKNLRKNLGNPYHGKVGAPTLDNDL